LLYDDGVESMMLFPRNPVGMMMFSKKRAWNDDMQERHAEDN
jgi:hypothetical protein